MGLFLVVQTVSAANISARDKEGVKLSKAWKNADIKPRLSEGGSVVFQYGAMLPTVICAPLRVCAIALQPGEKIIRKLLLGDKVRWKLSIAMTGEEGNNTLYAVVKPTEPNLDTSLIIPTNRRIYHIRLVSSKKDWMTQVSFEYSEDHEKALADLQLLQLEDQRKRKMSEIPVGSSMMLVENLNFEYELDGHSHWRPIRVFDDGSRTYIDLPRKAKYREAPVPLVDENGVLLIVNYRMHGVRMIMDSLFDKAVLLAGTGDNQKKVMIRRVAK